MYQLRGFVPITAFSDNSENAIAPFGELSPLCRSYSKDVNFMRVKESPDVVLAVFNNTRDNVIIEPEVVFYTLILNISQWLFNQSVSGELDKDPNVVMQALNAAFSGRVKMISVGEIISNGRYWFPTSMVCSALEVDDEEENRLNIWYADAVFQREYDLFEHVPAPPPLFDNLDDFFLSADTVIERIGEIDSELTNKQNNIYRGDYPETKLTTTNYNYVNPLDEDDQYPVPWSVFIYGMAGVNADSIRDTLVDFILKNSTHTKDEWEKIFPDLFTPTEFYIIPFWDRYSLPDDALVAGFYSPTIPLSTQLPTAIKYCIGDEYTEEYLTETVAIVGNIYRSMQFLAVGNPKNRHAPPDFISLWPKYAMISTTNIDFGRIDVPTREFMIKLTELLMAAEVATSTTIIPEGMTRVTRGEQLYMTLVHEKVQYVAAVKHNFESV